MRNKEISSASLQDIQLYVVHQAHKHFMHCRSIANTQVLDAFNTQLFIQYGTRVIVRAHTRRRTGVMPGISGGPDRIYYLGITPRIFPGTEFTGPFVTVNLTNASEFSVFKLWVNLTRPRGD